MSWFKYLWMFILGVFYISWSYESIKNIIESYKEMKKCHNIFIMAKTLDNCRDSALEWLIITILIPFIGSFLVWAFTLTE